MKTPDQSPNSKPISFLFHNTNLSDAPDQMVMHIRPEELTRTEVSRTVVHQTLGGGWADSFGAGVPTVQLAGQTGWRGQTVDGLAFFQQLRDFVYTRWHNERADANKKNLPADKVHLIFSDLLDGINWVCVPSSFTLRRNVSHPLLSYYQINLTWVADYVADNGANTKPIDPASVLDSFDKSLQSVQKTLTAWQKDVDGFAKTLKDPVRDLMSQCLTINQMARNTANNVLSVANTATTLVGTNNIMQVATGLSFAMGNLVSAVMVTAKLPQQVMSQLMEVRKSWLNMFCIFQNAVKPQKLLPDYNLLYGASMCSSTAGGNPLTTFQDVNSFAQYLSVSDSGGVSVSPGASDAINQIIGLDAAKTAVDAKKLATMVKAASGGIKGGGA